MQTLFPTTSVEKAPSPWHLCVDDHLRPSVRYDARRSGWPLKDGFGLKICLVGQNRMGTFSVGITTCLKGFLRVTGGTGF